MCNCSLCHKGFKLSNNSIKMVLKQKIDTQILAQVNEYSIYSDLYDKNILSALIQIKRKITNYNLQNFQLSTSKTPVK